MLLFALLTLSASLGQQHLAWAHESVLTLPPILKMDHEPSQVQKILNEIDDKVYNHPDLSSCIIKVKVNRPVVYFTVFCPALIKHQQNTLTPEIFDQRLGSDAIEAPVMLICMKSQIVSNIRSASFYLSELEGTPYGCPSGSLLLKVHEDIGRQLGASVSKLCDGSMLRLERGNDETSMVRSTLLYVLLDPPSLRAEDQYQLKSYYSQYGYSFIFKSDAQRNEINEAVRRIRSLTVNELASQIDTNIFNGINLKCLLLGYIDEFHGIEFITELLQLLCEERKSSCFQIIENLLQPPCIFLLPDRSSEEITINDSINAVEKFRDMMKIL